MKTKRTKAGPWGLCFAGLGLAAATACGELMPPLYVGNLAPIRDQYGRPMRGSYLPAEAGARSRLEIRTTTIGAILPPAASGAAHPNNPLLSTNAIGGVGLNAADPNSGLFAMVFPQRPAPGTKIFARAFNAPTLEQASFYADSALVAVPSSGSSLVLAFGPAQPLDAGDADGDGLANSWEKALGTDDRLTGDYDGDGMSDYHEMLAGTAADDASSLLAFRDIRPAPGPAPAGEGGTAVKPVRVKWQSVPGKSYQLFYIPELVGEQEYIPVGGVVTAGDGQYEMELQVGVSSDAVTGAFRVKLVVPE